MSAGQVVLFVLTSIVVIFAAYYATYFLASKANKRVAGKSRAIKVIDRFFLSKDKSVCLVEVKDRVYVIAFSAQSATLIDTRYADEFSAEDEVRQSAGDSRAYEPQGMVQKGLFALFMFIKNSLFQSKPTKPEAGSESHTDSGSGDDLDLMFKKLQNKRAGSSEQKETESDEWAD